MSQILLNCAEFGICQFVLIVLKKLYCIGCQLGMLQEDKLHLIRLTVSLNPAKYRVQVVNDYTIHRTSLIIYIYFIHFLFQFPQKKYPQTFNSIEHILFYPLMLFLSKKIKKLSALLGGFLFSYHFSFKFQYIYTTILILIIKNDQCTMSIYKFMLKSYKQLQLSVMTHISIASEELSFLKKG